MEIEVLTNDLGVAELSEIVCHERCRSVEVVSCRRRRDSREFTTMSISLIIRRALGIHLEI
jgi:hypothetical protein